MNFGFSIPSLICACTSLCFAYPVVKNGSVQDTTFKQVTYDALPDLTLVRAILTQSRSDEMQALYTQLQYLCFTCNEDWSEFATQLQSELAHNSSESTLTAMIPVKGQLKHLLTPFLPPEQTQDSKVQMSVASGIFLYTLSYLPPDEIRQLSLGYTGNLQEKFDEYACAFISPSLKPDKKPTAPPARTLPKWNTLP